MADTPKNEGILQTMFKPYVDVARGASDPIYRYENFPKTYEEYVDKKLVNKDGINTLTGKDREFYLTNKASKENFVKQRNMRNTSAKADFLSSALLMGGTSPKDIQQIKGMETKDPSDDYFSRYCFTTCCTS